MPYPSYDEGFVAFCEEEDRQFAEQFAETQRRKRIQSEWMQMLRSPHVRALELQTQPWRKHLSEEDRSLVTFARLFASHFDTGTDDCKRLSLILKLSELLDSVWSV